jgi:hypothetical protein
MHIGKVESVIELQPDEGSAASTRSSSTRQARKSGTYSKSQMPWLPTKMESGTEAPVVFAHEPRRFALDPALVSPEGSCRVVVIERGAQWPDWLARELSGGVTTYLVAEAVGDGLGGLAQRVEKRTSSCEMPVSQLIWLSAESKRLAPLRWIKRLAAKIQPYETMVIVPSTMGVQAARLRRHARMSTWPRAVVA